MKMEQMTDRLLDKMKAGHEGEIAEMETQIGSLASRMDVNQTKIEANREEMMAEMKALMDAKTK
jgi:hypothetical protein